MLTKKCAFKSIHALMQKKKKNMGESQTCPRTLSLSHHSCHAAKQCKQIKCTVTQFNTFFSVFNPSTKEQRQRHTHQPEQCDCRISAGMSSKWSLARHQHPLFAIRRGHESQRILRTISPGISAEATTPKIW